MTHIITSLCLRDGGCIEVCPVDCIVAGVPEDGWPQMYIDPETCIDCGACIPECPYEAIFTEEEVPAAFEAAGGEFINRPDLTGSYEGEDVDGNPVILNTVRELEAGEVIDLTDDIQVNYDFFEEGPGYGD
jgi:NAD-dependent dihydropyrimidine dehydrogenase PreA subunit